MTTSAYLDLQAVVGISKHMGGLRATRVLQRLCHVAEAGEVLEVGCGIGAGTARTATTFGCRVVGVDRSPVMIDWARERAHEARVEGRVELAVADVQALPFPDGQFDVAYCESVLGFVADKERAIAEMVRVTRPGGYVGIAEGCTSALPEGPRTQELTREMGVELLEVAAWRALMERAGLVDVVVRVYRIDPAREIRDRLRWVGLGWALRGIVRLVRLAITDPSMRPLLRAIAGSMRAERTEAREGREGPTPRPVWVTFGYALVVGRKPSAADPAHG